MRCFLLLLLIFVSLLSIHADFMVMNEGSDTVWLAFAYSENCSRHHSCWTSAGWYEVKPYQKVTLWSGHVGEHSRYWYIYAHNNKVKWSGNFFFAVDPKDAFRISHAQIRRYHYKNYEIKGFFQIDIAEEICNHTLRLMKQEDD